MQKSTARPASKARAPSADALQVLTEDHANVKKLFQRYESAKESASTVDKAALAEEICAELTAHATAEEEIFYPAVREALGNGELLDEAEVEHASAKELIAEIVGSHPDDALYDAKVKVLGEYIDHHVKEEEGEMFPKLRKAKLDLAGLGEAIGARKEEVLAEIVGDDAEVPAPTSRGRSKE